jgi:hypothetical protein
MWSRTVAIDRPESGPAAGPSDQIHLRRDLFDHAGRTKLAYPWPPLPTSNHLARPIWSRVGIHYSYRISLKSIETISISTIGRRSGPRV